MQAREDLLAAAHRLLSCRIDHGLPGPHDDAEAEYSEEGLLAAAVALVTADLIDRLDDAPISREAEVLRRLAAAWATKCQLDRILDEDALAKLPDDGPLGQLGSFLSALDHALSGFPGCLDPEEWEAGRRANVIAYTQAKGVGPLPPEPASAASKHVAGVCPMGCGETLFLGDGGHITCSYNDCPDPTAADGMLSQAASAQRTEEATVSATERFKLEGELDAMRKHVTVLLNNLKDQPWLKAAVAYMALDRMVKLAPDERDGGST